MISCALCSQTLCCLIMLWAMLADTLLLNADNICRKLCLDTGEMLLMADKRGLILQVARPPMEPVTNFFILLLLL